MTAATTTTHAFQPSAGSKSPCTVCDKTRGAKAHKVATVEEVRAEMLPDAADDAEVADAMEQADIEVAKKERTEVSVWVGRKIAEMAKAQKKGTLGAKMRAVTPSKAGDHTVKLNRAEADALSELATKVEGESTGMMALSARTLRARIDFAWDA